MKFWLLVSRCVAVLGIACVAAAAPAGQGTLVFEGKQGPGVGKHVVLLSGDEEYRSEESLPMLAKILAKEHGFKTTVLFSINKRSGDIDPETRDNTPGTDAFKSADLLIIATRFRDLPPDQMKPVAEFIESGKPIIGLRTSTHGFEIKDAKSPYKKYTWNYEGADFKDGFGRQILGETWVAHHGDHGKESTRGIITNVAKNLPIMRGVRDVWGPTDVYAVRDLPGATPLLMGQVVAGMKANDPALEGKKNEPMMPVAWIRNWQGPSGKPTRVFTTTMGASQDFLNEGLRRLVVNAAYWGMGMEDKIPAEGTKVDIVGPYEPLPFKFGGQRKQTKPADYAKGAEDLVISGAASGGAATARPLFNGKNLDGWVTAAGQPVSDGWSVEQGMLVRSGHGGDIYSVDSFSGFELTFDWKIAPGVNSGVKYRLRSYGNERLGPEYQIADDGADASGELGATASIYALFPPSARAKPVGEWNQTKIIARGTHIEHWLNGVKTAEADTTSDAWKSHVAKSKFAKRADFGQPTASPIMLQDHGPASGTPSGTDRICFRNIVIRLLVDNE